MKLSDYIVQFLIDKEVDECFGYPGGSVTNFLDSVHKREDKIRAHVTYHEQGAAFAACGYAQTTGKLGVAYATGGPGCTNLLTGMGQGYYDSIPVMFLTGNVNTYENKGTLGIRQKGFQESDNVSVARPLTKYAVYVDKPEKIRYYLEKAYYIAMSGRKGPVLLDLPMDIQRAQINPDELQGFDEPVNKSDVDIDDFIDVCTCEISKAERPCLIFGNGINSDTSKRLAHELIDKWNLPYVTSMIAFDVLGVNPNNYGFLGAYGIRSANFIAAKSDLLISVGSRMDIRQVGAKRDRFAPNAKIIRIDKDPEELKYKVHDNEIGFCMDAEDALEAMVHITPNHDYTDWINVCSSIRTQLKNIDHNLPNDYISAISEFVTPDSIITTDVGQNQVWVAQSFRLKKGQKVLFSGGFGSMGHALPAAIGAYYGSGHNIVTSFCGDGGLQMNIQEMQYIVRENLPIKIIVFNNNALGMIRHFQEMYFDSVFFQTKPEGGYSAPDFSRIADAYGIRSIVIDELSDIIKCKDAMMDSKPLLVEIRDFDDTYIIPKLEYGKPNQDQEPLLERDTYNRLMML